MNNFNYGFYGYSDIYDYNYNYNYNYNQQIIINKYSQYYPEIYKILNPMIDKICHDRKNIPIIDQDEINKMTIEIFTSIQESSSETIIQSGEDKMLYDLIQILILKELEKN